MTVGKGAIARSRVKAYVATHGLVGAGGAIALGEIGSRPATWPAVANLLGRIARYARLRTRLKAEIRSERRS